MPRTIKTKILANNYIYIKNEKYYYTYNISQLIRQKKKK